MVMLSFAGLPKSSLHFLQLALKMAARLVYKLGVIIPSVATSLVPIKGRILKIFLLFPNLQWLKALLSS